MLEIHYKELTQAEAAFEQAKICLDASAAIASITVEDGKDALSSAHSVALGSLSSLLDLAVGEFTHAQQNVRHISDDFKAADAAGQ